MQVLVVAGFAVVMALTGFPPVKWGAPWWVLPAGALAYVAVSYAATRANASLGLRRLMRPPPRGPQLGRAPAWLALGTQVYLVAALGGLMLAGWGSFVDETLRLGRLPLIGRLVALAPFVAALLAHWWAIYPLERAMRQRLQQELLLGGEPVLPNWTRRQFLEFNVRHHLLFVAVPVGIIIFVIELLALLAQRKVLTESVAAGLAVVCSAGVFAAAPAIILRLWRTRPLRAGPLRRRLEDLCRRFRLKYRQILEWDTGGVIVNAGVLGFLPPARYVLLSDALVEHLDEDAVETIFAHEAGHVVHHHILYLVVFTLGLLMACASVAGLTAWAVGGSEVDLAAQLPTLVVAGGLWGTLFGMLSRRFERQADVFAAGVASSPEGGAMVLTPSGVALFGRALTTVGRLNGIADTRRNFRHGSIRYRVGYLGWLLEAGAGPVEFDRQVRWVKLATWLLLGVGLVVMLLRKAMV